MYIYIVRHGQSMGNLKGGFAGHTDYPLSDLGHKQARMTADFLKDEHIETVISSTLTRAKQTAEPIAADRGLEVIGCKEFMEMNFGDWEGKPLDEVEREYNGAVSQWKKEMYKTVCPNGESTVDCYNRAVNALKETAAKYDGHDICIVSHGAIIKCLCCFLHGLPIEKLQDVIWADNASVTKLEYKNGEFKIVYECKSDHMGEYVTGVSKAMREA
ncbi:MAG: histidine phosphatase family protein [Clostridia bacterium]|nr:histidine phosphatase family protein [Clostridia bacterium]